eukprot:Polyplicarium_translucidae@DN2925_c0_g1_i2.p1
MLGETHPLGGSNSSYDYESQRVDEKVERELRHGFLRKVYGILCAQLCLTTVVGALFTFYQPLRAWTMAGGALWLLLAGVAAFVVLLVLLCVPRLAQRVPHNYILLAVFTVCEAFSVGGSCSIAADRIGSTVVTQAFFATAVVVVGLTAFAFQTKYDFTSCMGVAWIAFLALLVLSFIGMFFPGAKWLDALISGGFSLVFGLYVLIDTQVLLGRGKISVAEDDYILGALMLYIDIINLFVFLLQMLSALRSDD